jgi:hypothetical protein
MEIKNSSLLGNPIEANSGYGAINKSPSANSDPFSKYLQSDDNKNSTGALTDVKNYVQGFLSDARSVEHDVHDASLGIQSVESVVPKVAVFTANTEIAKGTAESIVGAAKALVNMQI